MDGCAKGVNYGDLDNDTSKVIRMKHLHYRGSFTLTTALTPPQVEQT